MPATKILWGQILVVLTIVLLTTWSATQWTAWRFGYQTQLGSPWTHIGGIPLYPPPAFFWWWFSYDAYAPAHLRRRRVHRRVWRVRLPLLSLLQCQCGAHVRRGWHRLTAPRAGPPNKEFARQVC